MTRDRIAESYDETPYPSLAVRETHPGRLAAIARLAGIAAPDPTHARVLELGCATGGNLLPMATGLPAARFWGVDLSTTQIAEARRKASAAHLDNVQFIAGDLRALPADLGPFDYVLCHGVLSWVPAEVRAAIFPLIGQLLSPTGVAYLSYNVSPGFYLRAISRDILRFYANGCGEADALTRLAHARRGLLGVASAEGESAYHEAIRDEVQNLAQSDPTYVVHEHLEDQNTPLAFDEFARCAGDAGLAWLAEMPFHRTWPLGQPVADDPSRDERAVVRAQREIDLHLGRPFRRSLLVHRSAQPSRTPDPRRALDLHVRSSVAGEHGSAPFAGAPELDEAWPLGLSVRELAKRSWAPAEVPALADHERAVAEAVLGLAQTTRTIELLAFQPPLATTLPERPHVPAEMRRALAEQGTADNFFHEYVSAKDDFLRTFVTLCDGTRTKDELIQAAASLPQAPPREVLARVIEGALSFLLRASLVCGVERPAGDRPPS